jgi:hypothetical protein
VSVFIVENANGYAPSNSVVAMLRRRAKKAGLYSDWHYCCVLADGDLLLCREEEESYPHALIASKHSGKWEFFTDTYLPLSDRGVATAQETK